MRILLATPPMTQLNTPYPATAYLTGFLRSRGLDARQADPALALVLALFSKAGLTAVRDELVKRFGAAARPLSGKKAKHPVLPRAVEHFLARADDYIRTVEPVVRFLQGRDPSLALRIAPGGFLPEGPRFAALDQFDAGEHGEDPLAWAFGALGTTDRARYYATLYIDDLADVIKGGIDPRFELSRYGERLAASAPSFTPLRENLEAEPTLVDRYLDTITERLLTEHQPDLLGLTVPFPGNVYGALRMARVARRLSPKTRIVMGGGYVNTELRELKDPGIFDYVDFITLDDGEGPILRLLDHLTGKTGPDALLRTFVRENGAVVLRSSATVHDIPFRDAGTPTYDGLPTGSYLSLCEMLNPMHRIWSDGRWNKLTLAHGCYWKQCNFCDVSLDYISRFEEQTADKIVDKIEALVAETGETGFHFVDEAAPPKTLFALANRLLARGVPVTWWGNVRFEKTFTPELAQRLRDAGCIAVSGGLEVASDRLLKLMNKGVTVEQVARVTHAFSEAGVLVHAYLMYGFPTQTVQETVDALERVRQLFLHGCIQSAYWHRFAATVHSPIGREPAKFGIEIVPRPPSAFANNDLDFHDPVGADHDTLGVGLKKALYNYMHGIGLDLDVRSWFTTEVPKAKVPKNLVALALEGRREREGRS